MLQKRYTKALSFFKLELELKLYSTQWHRVVKGHTVHFLKNGATSVAINVNIISPEVCMSMFNAAVYMVLDVKKAF